MILTSKITKRRSFYMENHYPPVIEKSIKVIQRFEEKFGWFVIRVYQFPLVDGFGTFLESVQRTLLRHGTAVWYIWAKIRGTDKILLIYFGRGLWEDTLNRRPMQSFQGFGNGRQVLLIWLPIPLLSISRTRTIFPIGWSGI